MVVTDLGVLEPDAHTRELVLRALHPGVGVDGGACGDRLGPAGSPPDLGETAPPTDDELAALRELQADGAA